MKALFVILITAFFAMQVKGQVKTDPAPDPGKKIQTVEASCGLCQFGMKAEDCILAVRIDGKTYWVDGTDIDSHGDAHAADGFCKAIRKAEVQGEIVNNRFQASYFKLLPVITKPAGKDREN
jgi:hypothetical protein